jgi:hypothetical protein
VETIFIFSRVFGIIIINLTVSVGILQIISPLLSTKIIELIDLLVKRIKESRGIKKYSLR